LPGKSASPFEARPKFESFKSVGVGALEQAQKIAEIVRKRSEKPTHNAKSVLHGNVNYTFSYIMFCNVFSAMLQSGSGAVGASVDEKQQRVAFVAGALNLVLTVGVIGKL
jgi:hypothetical protein